MTLQNNLIQCEEEPITQRTALTLDDVAKICYDVKKWKRTRKGIPGILTFYSYHGKIEDIDIIFTDMQGFMGLFTSHDYFLEFERNDVTVQFYFLSSQPAYNQLWRMYGRISDRWESQTDKEYQEIKKRLKQIGQQYQNGENI